MRYYPNYNTLKEAIQLLTEEEGENITWTIDRVQAVDELSLFIKFHLFNDYVDNLVDIQEYQSFCEQKSNDK
jgi:hypothetical protein